MPVYIPKRVHSTLNPIICTKKYNLYLGYRCDIQLRPSKLAAKRYEAICRNMLGRNDKILDDEWL